MPTPIGSGPNGGILMQDDDGSHYEVKGNTMTPVAKPDDAPPTFTAGPGLKGAVQAGVNGLMEGLGGKEGPLDELHPDANNWTRSLGSSVRSVLYPVSKGAKEAKQVFGDQGQQQAQPPAGPEAPVVDIKEQAQQAPPTTAPALPQVGGGGGGPAPQVSTKGFDEATGQAQDALRREGQARADAAKGVGDEWTKQANEAKGRLDDFNKLVAGQQAEAKKRLDDENAEIAKLGAGKVDPEHFWKSRSAGQRVAGGIALVLGGLAHGMGAENVGAKMIQEDIERDVKAQQFNIEQASQDQRARLAAKQTAFGHFMQITGDARSAAMATNAAYLEQAKLKVEGMKASLSAPAEIAAADRLAAELGQKSAEYKNQAILQNSQLKTQALAQQGQALQNEGQRLQLQYQRAQMAAASGGRVLDRNGVPPAMRDRAVYVGGKAYIDDNDKRAEEKRHQVAATSRAIAEIDGLQKWLEDNAFTSRIPWLEASKIAHSKAVAVASDFGDASGLKNALPAELMEQIKHTLEAGPTAGAGSIKGALEGLKHRFLAATRSSFESGGLPDPTADIVGQQPTEAQAAALKKARR